MNNELLERAIAEAWPDCPLFRRHEDRLCLRFSDKECFTIIDQIDSIQFLLFASAAAEWCEHQAATHEAEHDEDCPGLEGGLDPEKSCPCDAAERALNVRMDYRKKADLWRSLITWPEVG